MNDAFGSAHRSHASITGIPEFFPEQKCFGILMRKEIDSIEKVLKH